MLVLGPRDLDLHVYTFKEGLLSRVAHDLKIAVGDLELTVEGDRDQPTRVILEVNPASLQVVCAMERGEERPTALSASDRRTIEATIAEEVLHSRAHPRLAFVSERVESLGPDHLRLHGELELHGQRREITLEARLREGAWGCEATLNQPDFGIRPYRAMLGSLKVQPQVRVVARVPVDKIQL